MDIPVPAFLHEGGQSETKMPKLAPFFEDLFLRSAENIYEAIVIHKTPEEHFGRYRQRGREARRLQLQRWSTTYKDMQSTLASRYISSTARYRAKSNPDLKCAPIGNHTLPLMRVEVTQESLRYLQEDVNVLAVIPNHVIRSHPSRPRPYGHSNGSTAEENNVTWGLEWLGVADIWPITRGENMRVAVVSTGVCAEHDALKNNIEQFVMIDPHGHRIFTPNAFDTGSQGTHIAGTILGQAIAHAPAFSIAPGARLLSAAALNEGCSLASILEGIAWSIENHADVVNISFDGGQYAAHFKLLLKSLIDQYQVVPLLSASDSTPEAGDTSQVITVDAMERFIADDTFDSQPFKKIGSNFETILAPGSEVLSTIPINTKQSHSVPLAYMSGAATATAHVSGAAALLMAAFPKIPCADVISAMKYYAVGLGVSGEAGTLNLKQTFKSLR